MSERMYPGMSPDERTTFAPYSAFDIPADLRQLHGRYDVASVARRVRNFRYAEEWMMMIMGGWVATIPEVPVKTGLGKVIWEGAQAADEFGNRLPELRCGRKAVEASEASNEGFAAFVQAVAEPETPDVTIEKLVGVFDVLKPHLVEIYETTMREPDQISDAPTIEILETAVRKTRRHIAWGQEVLDRLCDTEALRERRRARADELSERLAASGGVTGTLASDRGQLN
ncbi:hypothetical protein MK280_05310 [Myxococcota bacterium]|nr:hypothetical protein [Myxococcota bacterium]